MKTVNIPVSIKVIVAIIDLTETLLIPQIPWPEVQPPHIRVPKPTSRPPIIINTNESVILKLAGTFVM